MVNKLTIIWGLLKKAISTMDLKVFSISLAIASFIWLVMTMSDDYTERIEFPVNYSNFPTGLILVNNPANEISVDVKSQGIELATVALSEKKFVNIDLNKIKFRKTKFGRYVASIATKSFRYNISNQLQVDDVGKDFIPDSIFFIFDSIITKNIPVKFNCDFELADGYIEYGEPEITPSSISVTGPARDVRKLDYIITNIVKKEDVKEDYNKEVNLTTKKQISYNTNKVTVVQKIAKYSEFTIKRRINVESNIDNINVKLFPQDIDVTFSIPLPDYKLLKDTAFNLKVRIDSIDILNRKKLLIDISSIPDNVDKIRMSSESVEYIIMD